MSLQQHAVDSLLSDLSQLWIWLEPSIDGTKTMFKFADRGAGLLLLLHAAS